MKHAFAALLPALLPLLALTGCSSLKITNGPAASAPPPPSVAVLDFTSDLVDVSGRAADGCVEGIVVAGGRPVERRRVLNVLQEKATDVGVDGPVFYQHLGEVTGANGFIVGSVGTSLGRAKTISVRLVNAKDGQIVRLVNFKGGGGDDGYAYARRACAAVIRGEDID